MAEWVLSSSLLIAVVMFLRAALGKRISARLRYGLWAVVLVRLLVPVSFITLPGTVPRLPAWTPPEYMQEESIFILPVGSSPLEESGVHVMEDGRLGDSNSFGYPKLTGDGETVVRYADKISPLELLSWAWAAGTAAMGIVLIAANLRFSTRLRRVRKPLSGTSTPIPVYVAAGVPSPCLVGLLRPAVYVTDETASTPAMLRHVLAHELTHYSHLDHLWSVLRGAALAVHWWNPLVWLALVCSRRDGELACDEGALKRLGDSERAAYGETLLTLVTARSKPGDLLYFATTMTGGKRSLKERIQRIAQQPKRLVSAMIAVVIILSLSVLAAFGQVEDTELSEESGIPSSAMASADDPLPYSPDLDRDGEPEVLYVRLLDRGDGVPEYVHQAEGTGDWRLEILRQSSDLLWSVTLDESHGGCGTYFLYQQDGLDYLMEYMPKMQQGYCTYNYRLFHFENGEEVTDVEKSVEFDINFASQDHKFDPMEIAAFMEEVNGLIHESPLLINTNQWMLCLDEDNEGRTRDNVLIALHYNGDKNYRNKNELIEALREFAGYAEDHPDDVESPLGMLLESLAPEDIGDISEINGQYRITPAQLVSLLRETAGSRLSRYHSYSSFAEEGAWMWTMAEWDVPLTGGGTLHLLACDSGNVELAYETGEVAVSAFYESEELYDLISRLGWVCQIEEIPGNADLDRDGKTDRLLLRSSPDRLFWCVQYIGENGEKLWADEAAEFHAGWNTLLLCRLDGLDYLLRYQPYMSTGICSYQYQLFYLENGREVVTKENSLEFDINFGEDFAEQHRFDPREIAAFMDEINALLENSTLLLSTDPDLLSTFEKEGRLYDSLWWLNDDDFTRDDSKSLLENLLAYRNSCLAQAAVPSAGEVFSEITGEDIVSIDAASVSGAELAEALNAVTDWTYGWRVDEWEALHPMVRVTYTRNGDGGEQTIILEAGMAEEKEVVRVTLEGQATALRYSENPANDATYLTDVPYSYEVYVIDTALYGCLVEHTDG